MNTSTATDNLRMSLRDTSQVLKEDLRRGSVHLYFASFSGLSKSHIEPGTMLSPQEKMRAESFHFEQDCTQFVLSRILLRRTLSDYTGILPADLEFQTGTHSKPFVCNNSEIHFNLSHSRTCLMIGIASTEIGVDIEDDGRTLDTDLLMNRVCTQAECEALSTLLPHERQHRFMQYWVAKESASKALGVGISDAFGSVNVTDVRYDSPSSVLYPLGEDDSNRVYTQYVQGPSVTTAALSSTTPWTILRCSTVSLNEPVSYHLDTILRQCMNQYVCNT